MIDLRGILSRIRNRILAVVYSAVLGRAVTAVLHVSPDGNGVVRTGRVGQGRTRRFRRL